MAEAEKRDVVRDTSVGVDLVGALNALLLPPRPPLPPLPIANMLTFLCSRGFLLDINQFI